MFFSFDHEHVVMNLTFRNPRPFKNNPQTSNLKAFNKTYNNKSKRFQMGKRRASELSTKRLEILGLAPNRANSLYDANRNISTVRQDNYRLSMVESIFDQLKKTASDDIENGIPEIVCNKHYLCIIF